MSSRLGNTGKFVTGHQFIMKPLQELKCGSYPQQSRQIRVALFFDFYVEERIEKL